VVVEEPFLLTAILTISSKDRPEVENVHHHCWNYMKQLMLDVLLGVPSMQRVGSVEGLLLLAEWVPHIQIEKAFDIKSFPGKAGVTEDSTAWSLVGQAVRQAYLLRLDSTGFRGEMREELKEEYDRKRLAWSCKYYELKSIASTDFHSRISF
jgi:hypothetical protein